jgi:Domain of unknown function (DUF4351)
MIGTNLEDTRIYRETKEEAGRLLILLQLEQRVGALSEPTKARIAALSLPQIESLAIALLGFSTAAELEAWLHGQAE